MQIDIEPDSSWLTGTTRPDQCPLCSKQMALTSSKDFPDFFTCYSCGFTSSPPSGSSVWIDPVVYTSPTPGAAEAMPSQGRRGSIDRSLRERQSKSSTQPKKQPNPMTPVPARASALHAG